MVDQEQELSDMLEGSLNPDTGTKKAIETLHPKDDGSKSRLSILSQEEATSHAIVRWEIKALKTKDLTKEFVVEGLSDSIMDIKVSVGGTGRGEVKTVFTPAIMGDMFSQGMGVPSMPQQPRRGLFSRFLGR